MHQVYGKLLWAWQSCAIGPTYRCSTELYHDVLELLTVFWLPLTVIQSYPAQFLWKLLRPCFTDGIELSYYEQNNTLSCHIRFTCLRIASPEVATSRITAANIVAENPGAFEGAWFQYHDNMFEVRNIENDFYFCQSVEVEGITINLPLDVGNDLVTRFGK